MGGFSTGERRRVTVLVIMIYLYESAAVMMYMYEQMRVKPLRKPAQTMMGVGRRDGESDEGQGRVRESDQSAEIRGVGCRWRVSELTHEKTRAGYSGGSGRRLV